MQTRPMSIKRTASSKRFNFPLIDNIERGLRKLKRTNKSDVNQILKTSESPTKPKLNTSEEIIDEETTTTITIRPYPQASVIKTNILGKIKSIVYAVFKWIIYLLVLLSMFGGLERAYELISRYFDEDTDRYEVIVLDRKEMRYTIGNK